MLQSPARRPASAGLGKGASAGARKSGAAAAGVVPQLQESQQTRSARKTSGARVYRDEELADIDRERETIELADKSEDETASPVHSNVDSSRNMAVKSSSSASGSLQSQHLQQQQRTIPPASITSTDESSVLLPLVQSRRGGKDNMPYIPPGANRPGLGKGKGKGKAYEVVQKNNSLKRDAQTASSDSLEEERTRREETETEEDHSSSLNVRSRSPRGVGNIVQWSICIASL